LVPDIKRGHLEEKVKCSGVTSPTSRFANVGAENTSALQQIGIIGAICPNYALAYPMLKRDYNVNLLGVESFDLGYRNGAKYNERDSKAA